MEKNFEDYQSVLAYEFEVRLKKNSAYSLRAFARDIGLFPSQLSSILSRKQGLSINRAQKVGEKLGFKKSKLNWFCNLVEAQHGRSPLRRRKASEKNQHYSNGTDSVPAFAKDYDFDLKWYHLAIRRMTLMEEFKEDIPWLSSKLKINSNKIVQALQDLEKNKLLVREEDGRLKSAGNIHFPPPNEARGKKISNGIAKAMHFRSYKARVELPPELRVNATHFMTIDKKLLPELRMIIQEFEDKIDHLTYKSEPHEELICVLISAFPVV